MVFKNKFTALPQCDSEGFLDTAAPCRGCSHDEMCPRSGHCERYDSPLRWFDGVGIYNPTKEFIAAHGITVTVTRDGTIIGDVPAGKSSSAFDRFVESCEGMTLHIPSEDAAPADFVGYQTQTFDGETGTYSDPQCSQCPWSMLDDDHLERIHKLWRDSDASQRAQLHALLDQARTRGL